MGCPDVAGWAKIRAGSEADSWCITSDASSTVVCILSRRLDCPNIRLQGSLFGPSAAAAAAEVAAAGVDLFNSGRQTCTWSTCSRSVTLSLGCCCHGIRC
jgi:hypothetical protein